MDEQENVLLTVAEVAQYYGRTDRAIYKQIADGKLSEYLVLDGGRKYLKREILSNPLNRRKGEKNSTSSISEIIDNSQLIEKLDEISQKLSLILERLPEEPIEPKGETEPLPPPEPAKEPERISILSRLFKR